MTRSTTDMGAVHEHHVNTMFGFTPSPGSGNQFRRQLDGRHDGEGVAYPMAHDCKSTHGKSLSVSTDAWRKIVEQAHGLRPVMPLRFYGSADLARVTYDLAVVDLNDLFTYWEDAERYQDLSR